MAKIDLFDPKWIEMVFAGKNREYGAYKLRKGTGTRNILALAILMSVALLIGGYLAYNVIQEQRAKEAEAYNAQLELSRLEQKQKEQKEEMKDIPPPPPPEKQEVPVERATQQYTVPEIKKEIDESKELKQQDQLDKKVETGAETKEGTNDANVLKEAVKEVEQPVVEEKKEEPPKVVEDTKVYNLAELAQQPSFPGGDAAMYSWLSKNLQYPPIAQENGISGTVVVQFVVEKDGSVNGVKVVRGKDPSLDKEAVRVVSKMPKWNPGKQNGQAVRVYYTLPVKFQLQ